MPSSKVVKRSQDFFKNAVALSYFPSAVFDRKSPIRPAKQFANTFYVRSPRATSGGMNWFGFRRAWLLPRRTTCPPTSHQPAPTLSRPRVTSHLHEAVHSGKNPKQSLDMEFPAAFGGPHFSLSD